MKSWSLWRYQRNELPLNNDGAIVDLIDNNTSVSLKFKEKITDQTSNNGKKIVKKKTSLNHSSNFWSTLPKPSIN